ncbi:hypothetical protein BDP27DRAFT_1322807 [Rhodocollybia butyracea]|uniref:Uncharacterized protein n=1 Tax=Rhodocollybia butyracea TaxID=206335 RepID=A0A9P5U9L5_9AGAR|nr:hypothetical protein BDP27DRAFT_1322807 [Rhodocollybia butyracea]
MSPGPTPPGTFSSTESDVSSFSDLPFEFPQPPPIGPILRRMKSSPMFTMADSSSSVRKRWGAGSLTDLQAELDFSPPFPVDRPTESYRGRIDGLTKELEAVIRADSQDFPFCSIFQETLRTLEPNRTPVRHHLQSRSVPFDETPSTARRRLTSFPLSTRNTPEQRPSQVQPIPSRQIPKMRSLKFAPQCNSSLERLDIPTQNPKVQKSLFRGRSISMDFQKSQSRPFSMGALKREVLPSPHRGQSQRISTNAVHRDQHPVLSTPFHHYPVDSNTVRPRQRPSRFHDSVSSGLKSFIDITPEQAQRKPSLVERTKVKKLLSRASQLFDWRKKA